MGVGRPIQVRMILRRFRGNQTSVRPIMKTTSPPPPLTLGILPYITFTLFLIILKFLCCNDSKYISLPLID